MAESKLSEFDTKLDELLDTFPARERNDLKDSLERAKIAAKKVKIHARDAGFRSHFTIKAALDLAVVVWEAEGKRRKVGQG